MSEELDKLASMFREQLARGDVPSIAGVLRDMGISPENPGRVKELLAALGYGEAQPSDATHLIGMARDALMAMPPEARMQAVDMASRLAAEWGGNALGAGFGEFLSSLDPNRRDQGGGAPPSQEPGGP